MVVQGTLEPLGQDSPSEDANNAFEPIFPIDWTEPKEVVFGFAGEVAGAGRLLVLLDPFRNGVVSELSSAKAAEFDQMLPRVLQGLFPVPKAESMV